MRTARKIENFARAQRKLEEFVALPVENDRDRAGLIQGFEFTFEACWKAFQAVALDEGLAAASPRRALGAALKLGAIAEADEPVWLRMLADRNATTHIYNEELAAEIAARVVDEHAPALRSARRWLAGRLDD